MGHDKTTGTSLEYNVASCASKYLNKQRALLGSRAQKNADAAVQRPYLAPTPTCLQSMQNALARCGQLILLSTAHPPDMLWSSTATLTGSRQ